MEKETHTNIGVIKRILWGVLVLAFVASPAFAYYQYPAAFDPIIHRDWSKDLQRIKDAFYTAPKKPQTVASTPTAHPSAVPAPAAISSVASSENFVSSAQSSSVSSYVGSLRRRLWVSSSSSVAMHPSASSSSVTHYSSYAAASSSYSVSSIPYVPPVSSAPASSSSQAVSSSSQPAPSSSSQPSSSSSSVPFVPSDTPPSAYDIVVTRGSSSQYFGPGATDMERGDLLRQAVSVMQSGDKLTLLAGMFNIDCRYKGNLRFPNNIDVSGAGMNATHLFGNCYSDGQGSAFEVRNGNYSDLTFENQTWDGFEDGRAIEMYTGIARTPDNVNFLTDANNHKIYNDPAPGPFTANFDRVKFISNAWTVYDWSGRGHTWNIRDSYVVSGRQGVSMMSGGGYMQNANIIRTIFDIDTMRSQDIGWTSKGNPAVGGAYGVVARGGNVKVEDSEFHMKCGDSPHVASFVPRCVGIYDGNDFDSKSSAWTNVTLTNNRWFIDGDFYGNESPDTYDIFMTNQAVKDKLIINGGCGSGTGCAILKNW